MSTRYNPYMQPKVGATESGYNLTVGDPLAKYQEKLLSTLRQIEQNTGSNLRKVPVLAHKRQPFKNFLRYYVPSTVRQIPSRLFNVGGTLLTPIIPELGLPIIRGAIGTALTQPGNHYNPASGTVNVVHPDFSTIAHEIGHYIDYERGEGPYKRNILGWMKNAPTNNNTINSELNATLFARKAAGGKASTQSLDPALATYLLQASPHLTQRSFSEWWNNKDKWEQNPNWKKDLAAALETRDAKGTRTAMRHAISHVMRLKSEKDLSARFSSGRFPIKEYANGDIKWVDPKTKGLVGLANFLLNTEEKNLKQSPGTIGKTAELPGVQLKPHQQRLVNRMTDRRTQGMLAQHNVGSGKALDVDTPILTANGWMRIDDICVGDEVVAGNGKLVKVLAVYPQGELDLYRLTFRDRTWVDCCADHLWFTQTHRERTNFKQVKHTKEAHRGKVRTTREIIATVRTARGELNHCVPVVSPIEFDEKPVPIDPYLLGLLLGDGYLGKYQTQISSADDEILSAVRLALPGHDVTQCSNPYDYRITNNYSRKGITTEIRRLGLEGKLSNAKFIPDLYKFNSIECRLAVLQGLMDTDGTCGSNGMTTCYESVSPRLKDDVIFLVQSLGGTAACTSRYTTFTYKGEKKQGQLCYRVWISLPAEIMPFRLLRKKQRVRGRTKYPPRRYIESVVPVGRKEAVCITVDDPDGLFVVKDCIVTHNTLSSIATWDALGRPNTAVVVPAALQENYRKELAKWVGNVPSNINIVSQQRLARQGSLEGPTPDFLVVDEQHKAREQSSRLRAALATIQAKKRLLLTGTPIFNHPQDISSSVNLAAGKTVLPIDRAGFNDRYIRTEEVNPPILQRLMGVKPGTRKVLKNTGELQKILKQYVDYHPKSTVDFPTSTEEVVKVPMAPGQTDIYNALMGKAPGWVRWKVKAGLPPGRGELEKMQAFLTGARQVSNTSRGYDRKKEEAAKIDKAFGFLQRRLNEDPNYKAIVYSNYLQSGLSPYADRLRKAGIPYGEFSGAMDKKTRDETVRQYNDNKLRTLLLSSAGAEGLDTKATSLVQLLDPAWNKAKEDQIIGRAIRYKSHIGLPADKQNVHIQRYLAQPKSNWFSSLIGRPVDRGVDEYIRNIGLSKDDLSRQMEALVQP